MFTNQNQNQSKDGGVVLGADSIVFLRCAASISLAKRYSADGGWTTYDRARRFDGGTAPLAGLEDLYRWLALAAGDPRWCAIRGALVAGERATGIRRLLRADPDTGDAATIYDVPRRWIMLDLDTVPIPAGVDPRDIQACAAAAVAVLPEAFRAARCIIQPSAGHGLKPGIRVHLWYWLSRPITCADARLWLARTHAPVDLSVCCAAQPHYTAAPIFGAGTRDPLATRLAWRDGAGEVAVPHICTAPDSTPGLPSTVTTIPPDRRLAGLMRRLMAAPHGTRHRMIYWTAARLGEMVAAGHMSDEYAVAWISQVCAAAGFPDPDHIRQTARDGIASGIATGHPITEFEVISNV